MVIAQKEKHCERFNTNYFQHSDWLLLRSPLSRGISSLTLISQETTNWTIYFCNYLVDTTRMVVELKILIYM